MGLQIKPLPAGVIRNFPQSAVTYLRGHGQVEDVPQIIFAVTGGEHTILVDTGTPPPEFVRDYHGYDFERTADQEPRKVLTDAGIDPSAVGTVIYTHLHWDHCGNAELFSNARFLIQADELNYAMDPLPTSRIAYERAGKCLPPWLPVLPQIEPVHGEVEVAPGVTIVPLPGHTPGSQGVLVETDSDLFLLAGDCVDTYRNWNGDGTVAHIPSGSFTNLHDYFDSFTYIERLHCKVVPSHDPEVLEQGIFG